MKTLSRFFVRDFLELKLKLDKATHGDVVFKPGKNYLLTVYLNDEMHSFNFMCKAELVMVNPLSFMHFKDFIVGSFNSRDTYFSESELYKCFSAVEI